MVKDVTYGRLRKVLLSLGCEPIPSKKNHFVFEEPKSGLLLMLPGGPDEQFVRPVDLSMIRRQLVGHGLLKDEEDVFDSLFLIRKGDRLIWTDPKTGKETRVTAAAGESDGLVVVKQNGSLLPCRVDEVRRVKRAATAARK
ncbi:MAG: hypothetical protein ACLQGP_28440 [Isosphaeraceae bacterium]